MDRKRILVAGALALLLVFAILPDGGQSGKETVKGTVSGCARTDNGYVFTLVGADGSETRCFSKTYVIDGAYLEATGRSSSDGGIFFVGDIVSNSSYTPIGSEGHVRRR